MSKKSWKPEVVADSSGKWCGNGLRFETEAEALNYAGDLMMRWTAVREYRAVECDEPAEYRYVDCKLVPIEEATT